MSIEYDNLPIEDQKMFRVISSLKKSDKEFLWKMIQLSNKDQICEYPEVNKEIRSLESLGLININTNYNGTEYSFIILEKAPSLWNILKKRSRRKGGFFNKLWGNREII